MSSKDLSELKKKLAAANWMVEEQQQLVDKNAANLKASQTELQKYVELAKAAEREMLKARPLASRERELLEMAQICEEISFRAEAKHQAACKLASLGYITLHANAVGSSTQLRITEEGRLKLEEANLAAKFKKAAK